MTRPLTTPMLGAALLLLMAMAPSIAAANPTAWYDRASVVCYPNAWTCTTRTAEEYGDVAGPDMPNWLHVYCPDGERHCVGPQYWALEFSNGSILDWVYVANPFQGLVAGISPVTGFGIGCVLLGTQEGFGATSYVCSQGTGFAGGSWYKQVFYSP